jgi:TolB-like protein
MCWPDFVMSAEVFISYAARDRERVLGLVERLRGAGVTVWIDQAGIDVSTMWSQEIVSAIKGCKVMLLSISPNSTESENVVKELALASERKKPIIPVYLEAAEIPETMEYQLAGIQRVEYFREKEDSAIEAMLRSLVKRGVHVDEKFTRNDLDEGLVSSLASHNPSIEKTSIKKEREIGLLTPILVLAIIGLILALFLKPGNENKPPISPIAKEKNVTNKTSIAVLPFRNIGPADSESFLADGMHEEIDAMLSMTPSLTVKNASRLKDSVLDPKAVGEALKVDSVLTGTVRQSEGKLRVTVKLIDTKSEENIWASTFDKNESDIFSVQREIAEKVLDGLKLELGQEQENQLTKRQTKDIEAYNLYIQGRQLWNTRTREGMRDSIEKFELALNKDKNFALAHVGIADAYNFLVGYGHSPSRVTYPKAKQELNKAFTINENLSEAYASLGWIKYNFDWDWNAAEKALKNALKIDQNNPEARRWLSHLYMLLGKYDEAIQEIDLGIEIMPKSANMLTSKATYLLNTERLEETILILKEAEEYEPEFVGNFTPRILAEALNGNFKEAEDAYSRGSKLYNGRFEIEKSIMLSLMGNKIESKKILNLELDKSESKIVSSASIATAYYFLENYEKTYSYLELAIKEKDPWLTTNFNRFNFNKIANKEKFKYIKRTINLTAKP